MPLTLQPLLRTDLPALVPPQYAAFHPVDKIHMLIYPSPHPPTPAVYERTVARHTSAFDQAGTEWAKVVNEKGDVVAAAKWIFYPTANPDRWTEAIDPLWILPEDQEKGNSGLGVEDKEYVTWVLSQTNKRRREDVTGPGALLDLCFTAPQYQGKGAGRLLVEWGTKRADEMGVPCFVGASKEGAPLYVKCGFVKREAVLLEGATEKEAWRAYGSIGYTWMKREARLCEEREYGSMV